jgi:hypothetical protein
MTTETETETYDVVVTQRYAEKEIRDANGGIITVVVTTSQVADKKGIDRQLHLEVSQPQETNNHVETVIVRKNLSWEDAERLRAAADSLAGVAERWRSIPLPNRNSIEFTTAVLDGMAIGKRTSDEETAYFVAATDDRHTARCGLGSLDALTEFVCHIADAARHLR